MSLNFIINFSIYQVLINIMLNTYLITLNLFCFIIYKKLVLFNLVFLINRFTFLLYCIFMEIIYLLVIFNLL